MKMLIAGLGSIGQRHLRRSAILERDGNHSLALWTFDIV